MTDLRRSPQPCAPDASRTRPLDGDARGPVAGIVQIEITTRCNYACFYCAGRAMPQRDMEPARVLAIIGGLPGDAGGVVSLQGEGEPSVHPDFWRFVEAVIAQGWRPYTILNGTRVDAARIARCFPRVGVSLDTVDPALADRIGRFNVAKVIRNLRALVRTMGGDRVVVHTTDFGQDPAGVSALVQALGARHVVQPLQDKDDYLRHYAARLPGGMRLAGAGGPAPRLFRCAYVERPLMRYHSIDGAEMPCCFIKDASAFVSIEDLRATLAARRVPKTCSGCRELR